MINTRTRDVVMDTILPTSMPLGDWLYRKGSIAMHGVPVNPTAWALSVLHEPAIAARGMGTNSDTAAA